MSFLPIVDRELRVASRQRGMYYSRLGGVGCAFVFAAIFMLSMQRQRPVDIGTVLFSTLMTIGFLYALFAGARFAADCVSEEKREGTLGLLFLTDLKGFDVVLGKLASCSIPAFYGLLAMTPVLTLPLLFGGVLGSEVLRAFIMLTSTLLLSLSAGVFFSTLSRHPRSAMALTVFSLIAFTGGIPWTGMAFAQYYGLSEPPYFFLVSSPGYAFAMSRAASYAANPSAFWTSCGLILGLSVTLLILSSIILPNCWQDRPAGAFLARLQERWSMWSLGDREQRHRRRADELDSNPIVWLTTRHRLKAVMPWLCLGLCACVWMWMAFEFDKQWTDPATYLLTTYFLFALMKVWVASEAVAKFQEDRRSGALELILSSSLTTDEILKGQIMALRRQFQSPAALVGVVGVVFLFAPFWSRQFSGPGGEAWSATFFAGLVVYALDLVSCSWSGLWLGLVTRQINRAIGTLIGRVLLLPWLLCFLTAALLSILSGFGVVLPNVDSPAYFSLGVWFVFNVSNSLFWIARCRRQLVRSIRDAATSRPQLESSRRFVFWRRLFGGAPPSGAHLRFLQRQSKERLLRRSKLG